jgi:acetyl-CoA carboxylase, biotin carboxylase subunit
MIIEKVLIANRGEIARRIMRTCKRLGISTVAVYSEADADMPFVQEADEAVLLGPPPIPKSYLNLDAIFRAVKQTGAQAIHPGYGLLSENPALAERCLNEGICFIGPNPRVVEQMGDKIRARQIMQQAGLPVVPGSIQALDDLDSAIRMAEIIGYPIMLKASSGGGGIGMQQCFKQSDIEKAFHLAKGRAKAYFGNDEMFMEKYIERPHHIEVQIAADNSGQVIHLLERECSVQRRHQKVIEESPSPFISPATREGICRTAVLAAQAVHYSGVGTIEFIVGADQSFYFLEMNTRLQVEHGITEEVVKIDLVEWQIRIAEGKKLPLRQENIKGVGHAMEFRIYAEDPDTFLPSPGKVSSYEIPNGPGIRIDDGITCGSVVTPFYDPLLAKLIVVGSNRSEVIRKAEESLAGYRIGGIKTNIPLLQRIVKQEKFSQGRYDTTLISSLFNKEK